MECTLIYLWYTLYTTGIIISAAFRTCQRIPRVYIFFGGVTVRTAHSNSKTFEFWFKLKNFDDS